MIKYFKTKSDKKVSEVSSAQKDSWIYMENPSQEEILTIADITKIPKHFFDSALDEEEQARIENDNDISLIVIDIAKELEEDDKKIIVTIPMALIFNNNYFITVCTKPTSILDDFQKSRILVDTANRKKLLYQMLYNNFTRFLFYLKKIDKMSNELQNNISKLMENKEILETLELQKALVFFSASLSSNHAVIQKIINSSINKNTPEEKEILDDILIEARQAIEMCTIYREILKNSMDAFSSIANNNMNLIMKFLTAITIVLSIPMIVSGFWGMNTGVPMEGFHGGFWVAITISFILSMITLAYFIKRKML